MNFNPKNIAQQINELISRQKEEWPLAKENYAGLEKVQSKVFPFDGFKIKVQHNPERILSSAAKTDKKSIEKRPCFLCQENRPKEQESIDFAGKYSILLNPYPIFPEHLTIVYKEHLPQGIAPYFPDMLQLSKYLPDFTIFYNGPQCGASAPDHFHFQAGSKNMMPVDTELLSFASAKGELLLQDETTQVVAVNSNYLRNLVLLISSSPEKLNLHFQRILKRMQKSKQLEEPMLNILVSYEEGNWRIIIFPRDKQRPDQFYAKGEQQILISPAAVELGGLAILPRREDFEKITSADLQNIYKQVSINNQDFEELKKKITSNHIV